MMGAGHLWRAHYGLGVYCSSCGCSLVSRGALKPCAPAETSPPAEERVLGFIEEARYRIKAAWSILRHGHWYED